MTRRAAPKSSSTGTPSSPIRMLSGAMSRWNTPSLCSTSSADSSASSTLAAGALARRHDHAGAHLAQRAALVVGHHHVGGAVVLPEAIDLDQRRVVEAGQHARFVDERAQAEGKGLGHRGRSHRHRQVAAAAGQRARHVLLERHFALERMVPGQVDDAEAAAAEHAANLELGHARAHRQRARRVGMEAGIRLGRRARQGPSNQLIRAAPAARRRARPMPARGAKHRTPWLAADRGAIRVAPAAEARSNAGFAFSHPSHEPPHPVEPPPPAGPAAAAGLPRRPCASRALSRRRADDQRLAPGPAGAGRAHGVRPGARCSSCRSARSSRPRPGTAASANSAGRCCATC